MSKKIPALDQIPLLIKPDQVIEKYPQLQIFSLSNKTPILYLTGILTASDCEHLIQMGRPHLADSTMVVNNKEIVDKNRSSRTGPISYNGDPRPTDPVMAKLVSQVSDWTGLPPTHIEAIKVVHYQQGQKYVPHHDYFTNAHPQFLKQAGDRCLTFFVYLNSVAEKNGGTTHFPKLGLAVQPKVGDGVFWLNMNSQGEYLDLTEHGGAEVTPAVGEPNNMSEKSGQTKLPEKWGLNVWIRERPFR